MIHQYKLNGFNIVLDVCSGSVHVVDDVAYDIIAEFENKEKDVIVAEMLEKYAHEEVTREDVLECFAQVEELKENGKLFAPDTFEPMANKLKEKTAGVVKALCLHIAHTCNLNCSYCFASQGKYHGDRAVMSFEVGKQALDFLVANSGTRHNLEVDFFGGEPLMNFQVVKDLVAYARSIEKEKGKNFRFTLTTNGVLVDEDVIEWANRECSNVVLSLDGRKEVHDRFRVDYAGNASNKNCGKSFLSGGNGASDYYSRAGFSVAGFGGGGGSRDDGEGGGGGGYYGGTVTSSACSYISDEATNTDRVKGENFGHGYLKITFLKVGSINARCKVNGEIKNIESAYIKSNGVWKEVSEIRFKQNGAWKQV